jgi:hypothetical protein
MLRLQVLGFVMLVGGLIIGGGGWKYAMVIQNEALGLLFGFIGLMVVLCGGLLLHAVTTPPPR